jgi:hypothetical protein
VALSDKGSSLLVTKPSKYWSYVSNSDKLAISQGNAYKLHSNVLGAGSSEDRRLPARGGG